MIRGMTGFGSGQLSLGKIKAVVEIKTLNHRYFDVSYYLPIGFTSLESVIQSLIQKYIERGRVTVTIKITDKPGHTVSINKETMQGYLKLAQDLRKNFGIDNDLKASDVLRLPGVLETKETLVNPKDVWPQLEKCLQNALKGVVLMRSREGSSLTKDIQLVSNKMLVRIKKIRQRTLELLREKKKTLSVEEFVSFQKGNDVNEEMSRLEHYIQEIKLLLKNQTEVGKKIDFIAQEMQRETNTIGSKVQDKTVSDAVIALKSKVEKIREQAQNIE
jgi:uncharacterized protein (TIGR00255 family)